MSRLRLPDVTIPAVENILSTGAEDAGITRRLMANDASIGNVLS